jgi:hypothetical protein
MQKVIPEKTSEKAALGKEYQAARRRGDQVAGLNEWNIRWVGPDGYRGIVARQLQEFKRQQRTRTTTDEGARDEAK